MRDFTHFWNETQAVCREQPRTQPALKSNLTAWRVEEKINTQGNWPRTQPGRKKETWNREKQALSGLISAYPRQVPSEARNHMEGLSLSTGSWGPFLHLVASTFRQKSLALVNEQRSFQPSSANSYSTLHISFHSRIPPSQIKRQFLLPIHACSAETGLPSDEVKGPRTSSRWDTNHSDSHEGRGAASLCAAALPSS